MKFNFKKIASVLTGVVMVSSTVALAAAANFPAPFVQNGAGDYAVVYGSAAVAGTDNVAAADINAFLTGKVTTVTPQPVETNLSLSGEVVPLFKSNNKINLGDALNSVVDDVDYNKLPTVLAQSVFTDEDGTEYDYDQTLTIGSVPLTHFSDSKVDASKKPVIGFADKNDAMLLEYEMKFNDALNSSAALLKSQKIEILGKEWFISNVEDAGLKLTLLDSSNEITMIEGSTQTITVGDKSYEITVDTVESDGDVTFKVGTNTYTVAENANKKISSSPDTYLAVTNSIYSEKKDSKVSFTLGAGSVVIADDVKVKVNDESVKGLVGNITTNDDDKITSVKLTWAPTDDTFLIPGKELTMPVFGGVKLSYTSFTFGTPEELTVGYDTDDIVQLQDLELQEGKLSTFDLMYGNGTGFVGLGTDAENILVTEGNDTGILNLELDENPIFVATWVNEAKDEWESYVFQLSGIEVNDDDTVVTIDDLVADKALDDFTITATDLTPDRDVGEINLAVLAANETTATIEVTASSGVAGDDAYTNVIVTKGGLWIDLPATIDSDGLASYALNFTEANKDATVQAGNSFTVSSRYADEKVEVTGVSGATGVNVDVDSDNEEYVIPGQLATKILYTAADDRPVAEITYHTTESYANVYVAEAGASTGTGGSGGSSGWLPVKDSEVSSVSSKNLLVVGGSCVNTVAAKLLGSDTPLCEAAWLTATNNVGAGSFLIQTFANPWSTGKVATLVAGYDSTDTANAVSALKVESIDTTVGKKYVKLASSNTKLV